MVVVGAKLNSELNVAKVTVDDNELLVEESKRSNKEVDVDSRLDTVSKENVGVAERSNLEVNSGVVEDSSFAAVVVVDIPIFRYLN